jgi:hypothetical protein
MLQSDDVRVEPGGEADNPLGAPREREIELPQGNIAPTEAERGARPRGGLAPDPLDHRNEGDPHCASA